jgi:hypothetical protein
LLHVSGTIYYDGKYVLKDRGKDLISQQSCMKSCKQEIIFCLSFF